MVELLNLLKIQEAPTMAVPKTDLTLTIEDGQVTAIPGINAEQITDLLPPDMYKLHESTFVTVIAWSRTASTVAQCCYYVWMGGRWVKVCKPC
jgi:hypothetical protein